MGNSELALITVVLLQMWFKQSNET